MDPYELEFRDRPRSKHAKRADPGLKRDPFKKTVMLAVQQYISTLQDWQVHDIIPVNMARQVGMSVEDVTACLKYLASQDLIELCPASKKRTYRIEGREVAWNGKEWVFIPNFVHAPGLPPYMGSRSGNRKVRNRRMRKRETRSASQMKVSLAHAKKASWHGMVFFIPSSYILDLREGLPKIVDQGARPKPCKKCGHEGCLGGSKGRKDERRRDLKACADRIVEQIMGT